MIVKVNFQCPVCENVISAPEGMRGQLWKCPHCKYSVKIPEQSPNPPNCEYNIKVPEQSPNPPKINQITYHLIDCPVCANKVSSQASICPKCGHPISTRKNASDTEAGTKQPLIQVNLKNGIITIVVLIVFISLIVHGWRLMIYQWPYRDSEVGISLFLGLFGYLIVWGYHVFIAVKRNDIAKILFLIFLPGLGIIISAFIQPMRQPPK